MLAAKIATPVRAWRLDRAAHAASWDTGIGAYHHGGRWNPKGVATVYCSLDPSTAIMEVAVHIGFAALDATPHVLSALELDGASKVHVVQPSDVPDPAWLMPGTASAAQQAFGRQLMESHDFVAIPSAVSRLSWNLIFDPGRAAKRYALLGQEPFALDPRLHAPRR